jgi:hypothetical protein
MEKYTLLEKRDCRCKKFTAALTFILDCRDVVRAHNMLLAPGVWPLFQVREL